jgi:hypothetical protein
MGLPPLPVELTDRIIDFCHDDQKTLSNCALTHSSWLPTCRFHLFHTITSAGEDRTNRAVQLKSIASSGPVVGSQRWPSVLPYIKIVKIASSHAERLQDAQYLAHIVRCLCSFESLSPPSVHMRLSNLELGPGVLSTSLSQINDIVTHVQLLNISLIRKGDIWKFLSSLSRLQHLELSEIGFYHSTGYSHPTERTFEGIPLSKLRMSTASMGFVITSLIIFAGSLPHLEDFGIVYQDIRQEELPQLAEAIQRTVKCLRFSASCYPGDQRGAVGRPSAFDISEKTSSFCE